MGQIQNAISGLVSTAVGATIAKEMKTEREVASVSKDLDTFTTETKKAWEKREALVAEDEARYNEVYLTKKGNPRKKIDPMKEMEYNEWSSSAFKELNEEFKTLVGWKTNLAKRIDALKAKGVESLDFEVSRKHANEALTEIHSKLTGGKK